ncbi:MULTISPECIES: hybrid sensor histidine kinase/response regulator [Pseudomonas aeruginosa group]|nr:MULTISPECIES: NahK/ErcS family hybrid sensor histidine kinase/response regulator [Pseudomonas aeruginosa group]VTS66625.1 alkaline phosphatase synthesis sensor protein [Streptococcus dysgalactiae subsp. equisimilis]KPD25748.1 histidine kinase [Pseudomonas paraeruginosa]KRU91757.1 histidine kinase [Pseudomonas aeruginosa]KSD70662.1 hybrid sensor histidine kinase/response regulator [Pseudomonas aeruginosa]KSP83252.1 hybrid sensor histidine kinase/response regulator [Pseudomonas aeruginosa]
MARPSERQQEALAGLLGLGSHSARKSHYPELLARLEELEAERNRYKWLFEHAVHGIFQASLGHGLRAANPALAQMLGYDDPQQVLWSLEDMAGQLFVGGEAEMRRIRTLLRERGGLFGYETRLWRKDGSHIEVLMNLLLRHDEEELVEGFVADITERVQAQQRLQSMNEELERRVAGRTRELEELNRQLRQARDAAEAANHSKDKYLAAASHDLLQPLNAARLLVDTLRERGLPAAELQLVERTHLALEGAETLLTDLLEIARLDQSAIRPELDDYSLDELLGPLVSEFEEVARASGLALRARIPRLAVRTDARLLSRILRNFLSNACRYTERGAVLLGARRRGGNVRLEVWDSGRGIPADQLQAIFLEFNQLDVGRASERRGVGLGLAIVDRIAGILGYRIEVHSIPGRGSLFAIEVPVVREPSRPAPGEAPARVSAGDPLPGRRLLVVDNETEILFSMAALLGQWGCEVLTASDLESARRVLGGRAPDVILADYHLDHGATGCQLLGALRADYGAAIPAVMITADRSDDCRRALNRLGVPLLNKPLKPGKLRAALSALLGEAQGASRGAGDGGRP